MKVSIKSYNDRWVSYVHDRYMDKKYNREWTESNTRLEKTLETLQDGLQWVYNKTINKTLDKLERQRFEVRIDPWDTWSVDHTLAPIILPMLIQLKATKHGAPLVTNSDVPKELQATKENIDEYCKGGNADSKHFERWDWVLDEMIWAFEQKCRDHWQEDYYGPYIEGKDGELFSGRFEWTDDEGSKAHQLRMTNGFRLFGKYYEHLWD
tara:strand:- start:2397 stop:3023 length:627 start_codon:yes stop_codon:yes gene_type:complete